MSLTARWAEPTLTFKEKGERIPLPGSNAEGTNARMRMKTETSLPEVIKEWGRIIHSPIR